MIVWLISLGTTIAYIVLILAIFGRIKLPFPFVREGKGFETVFSLRWPILGFGILSFIITIFSAFYFVF